MSLKREEKLFNTKKKLQKLFFFYDIRNISQYRLPVITLMNKQGM